MKWFCFWKGKRDMDFKSSVAAGGDSLVLLLPNLLNKQ